MRVQLGVESLSSFNRIRKNRLSDFLVRCLFSIGVCMDKHGVPILESKNLQITCDYLSIHEVSHEKEEIK